MAEARHSGLCLYVTEIALLLALMLAAAVPMAIPYVQMPLELIRSVYNLSLSSMPVF